MIFAKPSTAFTANINGLTTGLEGTVAVRLINAATRVVAVARTTAGIDEDPAGSGSYTATVTAPATEGRYEIGWDTGTTTPSTYFVEDVIVDQYVTANGAANLASLSYLDATVSSRATANAHITYVGPVAINGDVTIVRGDDYSNTDSRSLQWETDDAATWPTLTSATITLTAENDSGTQVLTKTGAVVTATGTNKKVRVELAAADTASITPATYRFDVQAVISTRKITLVRGLLTIVEDFT